jgi:hypothetical protein
MKVTIVTACDGNYFDLLQGLILSVREKREGQEIGFCFLDVGCSPEQIEWIEKFATQVKKAKWDVDTSLDVETLPKYMMAMTCRPFIRNYFDDYDIYIWIDADAWVQDWSCIDLYIRGASTGMLTVTPELDRVYTTFFTSSKIHQAYKMKTWRSAFGEEVAEKFHRYPFLNSGVFSLSSESPVWEPYAENLNLALSNGEVLFAEQLALNKTAYELGGNIFLPAYCNWMCHYAYPLIDEQRRIFTEPALPFHPIGIVHLTAEKKRAEYRRDGLYYKGGAYLASK